MAPNKGKTEKLARPLFLHDFNLNPGERTEAFYLISTALKFEEFNLCEVYLMILIISINLSQIKIGASANNKINVKQIIPLSSSNTYIKFITSSKIGKFFSNVLSIVSSFNLFDSNEVDNLQDLVMPIYQGGESSIKINNPNVLLQNKELRNIYLRGKSRSLVGLFTTAPFYKAEGFLRGNTPVEKYTIDLILQFIPSELKVKCDVSKVTNYLKRCFDDKVYYDCINVIANPTSQDSNITCLEDSLGLAIERVVAPPETSFEPSNLNTDETGISEFEKIRRKMKNKEITRKVSKKKSK